MYSLFNPIDIQFDFEFAKENETLGGYIQTYTKDFKPDYSQADILMIGFEEERNAIDNKGTMYAPNEIRKALYKLFPGNWNKTIVDLGNITQTDNISDVYYIAAEISKFAITNNISLLILGGSQDVTYAISKAFDNSLKLYNICVIDAKIDGALVDNRLDNENYLTKMLSNENSRLHNLSILATQTYYNHPAKYKVFEKLYVDNIKLSEIKENFLQIEPEIRDAHFVSIDTNSIQNADFPAQIESSPNGLTGLEICKLTKQIGIAPNNKVLGIFETNPFFDKNSLGVNLLAQAIWYYFEGKNVYIDDYPFIPISDLLKFYVNNDILNLIFYKNDKTNRWWVEILDLNIENNIFSCAEVDYLSAVNQKITKRIYHIINKNTI